MADAPNPFCTTLPGQLRAWDATALRCFQECPRKYQLNMIQGWRGSARNWDIEFGSLYHDCVELFDRERACGATKGDATNITMAHLLAATWAEGSPWSGTYVAGWRCNNWVPGKRSKFNCDAARSWFSGHTTSCPKCHGSTTNRWVWAPEHKVKNRYTLFSAVLLYCDEQKEAGGVQTIVFPDGQVALELSFTLELPYVCPDGSPYLLCGHLDSMVTVTGDNCIRERKTTRSSVGLSFFDRYAPDTQIDVYDLAGNMLFGPTLHPTAVMMEVMQVGTETSRLQRGYVHVTEGRREETLRDIGYWIAQAEACAVADYYPKNTASCNNMNGCQYRRICSQEPGETRQRLLETYYHQDPWNPLKER